MWAPLRHPMYRRLVIGRVTTFLGNAVAPVALAFAVLDLTGSVAALGIVVGARSLANVALLLLGGVLADRLPRGVILQGASMAAAGSQALTAVAVLMGFASVPLLIVLSVVNGAVAAVSLPAASALTPQTVPPELLRQANALARIGINTAMIVGASLGGMVTALVGSGWAMVATAAVFAVAAVFYARVKAPEIDGDAPTRPLADLKAGWREFASRPWVWSVVASMLVINAAFVGGLMVLGPSVADETVGRLAWGFILGAQTAGALVGGIIATRWQPRRALLVGTALIAVTAAPLFALAHWPAIVPLAVAMVACGIAVEQFGVAWDVSLQENVPQDKLARVYSYDAMGSFIAIPLGEIAVGPLAQRFGASATLTGAGVLILLAVAAAVLTPGIRTLTLRKSAAG
ncbi:MFS transporter [Actinokineospora guangxiensis]|uniref:MFS transporter n=1 Tax=Actinokineospora guangxiensis TaxID=1490288 RepID=A0ABW0EP23_9PSEU